MGFFPVVQGHNDVDVGGGARWIFLGRVSLSKCGLGSNGLVEET